MQKKRKQNIKKNLKRLVGGALFLIGCSPLLNQVASPVPTTSTTVYAAETDATTPAASKSLSDFDIFEFIDLILKVVYIMLWPLLFIAGIALDNSMVYGSFLHMDAPLRQFWNMTKNFANFALGFLVLYNILKMIFSFGENKDIQKIIKNTLIAGVGIQVSWFLMAAVVDLSSIGTYAIGGLPLSVMKNSTIIGNLGDKRMLSSYSSLNFDDLNKLEDSSSEYSVYFGTKTKASDGKTTRDIYLSKCKIYSGYIVGRDNGDEKFNNIGKLGTDIGFGKEIGNKSINACVYGQDVIFYNEFPDLIRLKTNSEYKTQLNRIIKEEYRDTRASCKYVIQLKNKNNTGNCTTDLPKAAEEIGKKKDAIQRDRLTPPEKTDFNGFAAGKARFNNTGLVQATHLSDVIKRSKGQIGPLATMYISLLDFASLSDTSLSETTGLALGELLIRTGVALGLIFPLIALCIVLIIRVGFLRVVIAATPLLVLKEVFAEELGDLGESIKTHFNIANIIKIIFAPVITVFAVSISLVFMSLLINSFKPESKTDLFGVMGIETKTEGGTTKTAYNGGTIEVDFENLNRDRGIVRDPIGWLIICAFGIGIMRTIVFAAIKSNSIGSWVGESVQKFGENVFKTMPIVPLGNGIKGGLGSTFTTLADKPNEWVNKRKTDQDQEMGEVLEEKYPHFIKGKEFSKDNEMNDIEMKKMMETIQTGDKDKLEEYRNRQGFSKDIYTGQLRQQINNITNPEEKAKAEELIQKAYGSNFIEKEVASKKATEGIEKITEEDKLKEYIKTNEKDIAELATSNPTFTKKVKGKNDKNEEVEITYEIKDGKLQKQEKKAEQTTQK